MSHRSGRAAETCRCGLVRRPCILRILRKEIIWEISARGNWGKDGSGVCCMQESTGPERHVSRLCLQWSSTSKKESNLLKACGYNLLWPGWNRMSFWYNQCSTEWVFGTTISGSSKRNCCCSLCEAKDMFCLAKVSLFSKILPSSC